MFRSPIISEGGGGGQILELSVDKSAYRRRRNTLACGSCFKSSIHAMSDVRMVTRNVGFCKNVLVACMCRDKRCMRRDFDDEQ